MFLGSILPRQRQFPRLTLASSPLLDRPLTGQPHRRLFLNFAASPKPAAERGCVDFFYTRPRQKYPAKKSGIVKKRPNKQKFSIYFMYLMNFNKLRRVQNEINVGIFYTSHTPTEKQGTTPKTQPTGLQIEKIGDRPRLTSRPKNPLITIRCRQRGRKNHCHP